MGGPELGRLFLDDVEVEEAVLPEAAWSADSSYLAYVKFHDEQVPNRKGAEGFSFRLGILRLSDRKIRYCLGNMRLAKVSIIGIANESLTLDIDGNERVVSLRGIRWD